MGKTLNRITKLLKKTVVMTLLIIIVVSSINIPKVKSAEGTQMVANCSKPIDGGLGDSTGQEYLVMNWYDRPWDCVLRHPDGNVAKKIAQLAVEAANNDHIGYSNQYPDRMTFWEELEANNYSPSAIKNDCASDCSGSTGMIVRSVGHQLNKNELTEVDIGGTTTMREDFSSKGFNVLTGSEYTSGPDNLQSGDILLNEALHATIYVGDPGNIQANSSSGGGYKIGDGTQIADCVPGAGGFYDPVPGDQGGEYTVKEWWDAGWDVVYRYPDENVANTIAALAIKGANNDNIRI